MANHPPNLTVSKDPYSLLALTMLEEAFRNIKCYYTGTGSKDELIEGRRSLRWIRRMESTYRMVALATNYPLDRFHQMCLWKINQIKAEAIRERKGNLERTTMVRQDR